MALLALASCGGGGGGSSAPPAAPTITSFTANPATITVGSAATLTGVFANGTGVVSPGSVTLASGTGASVTPAATGTYTYTLTVTNSANATTTSTATVTVVDAPTVPTITAAASVTAGSTANTASVAAQAAGSTYTWTIANGTITDGGNTAQISYTAGNSGTVDLTCTVTNAAGTASAPGTISTPIVAGAVVPVITVNANVTASAAGQTASVPNVPGSTYAWSITGGTITSGGTTNAITFTPGTSGTVQLGCVVTNAAGTSSATGTAVANIVEAPVISSFVAAAPTVTTGSGTNLTAVFTGGTATVDHSLGTFATGAAKGTGALTSNTTYTLTVTNAAGTAVTSTVTVDVVAAPVITSFVAAASPITTGTATNLTAVFTGGTATVSPSVGAVTTGTAKTTGNISANTTYTLTVTNAAGTAVTSTVTVNVVAAPVITSFVAAASPITTGTATNLTAVFTGGTATVSPNVGAVTTGTAKTTGNISANTTYTLTVTNAAGTSATETVTVNVVAAPVITSFAAANNNNVTTGKTASLTAVFTGGTGTIDNGVGTVTSGTAANSAILTSNTAFTLTVTNAAGAHATSTVNVTVVAAPAITSFSAPHGNNVTTGDPASLTAVFTGGTGSVNQGIGAVTSGVAALSGTLTNDTTFTLTVTNAAGDTTTQDAVVTVVAAPSITSFAPAKANVTTGTATTLTAVFTGGTGSVDNALGTVTSGTAKGTGNLTNNTTYTLTVTNAAGTPTTQQATVSVVAAPAITSFSASPAVVASGANSTLSYTYSGGTASIIPRTGTVFGTPLAAPGTSTTVSPTVASAYALVVTNAAGDYAEQEVQVAVQAVTGTLSTLAGVPSGVGALNGLLTTPGTLGTGVSTARFNAPAGLAMDNLGNILVAEWNGGDIRRITPGGATSVFVGVPTFHGFVDGTTTDPTAPARIYGPYGLAVDDTGNVFIADRENHAIRMVTTSAAGVSTVSTLVITGFPAGIKYPNCIVVDHAGNLYISDSGNATIAMLTPTGTPGTYAYTPLLTTGLSTGVFDTITSGPQGLALDAAGNLYYANGTSVGMLVPPVAPATTWSTGTLSFDFTNTPVAGFTQPTGLAFDGSGNLYVTDPGRNCVFQFSNPTVNAGTTTWTGYLLAGSSNGLQSPYGLAISGSTLYVSDLNYNIVTSLTIPFATSPFGGAVTPDLVAGMPGLNGDANGQVSGTGGSPANAHFNNPQAVCMDGSGNLYIADTGNHAIRFYNAGTGMTTTIAGWSGHAGFADGSGTTQFRYPTSVALDSTGLLLYVADQGNNCIRLVSMSSAGVVTGVSTVGGDAVAQTAGYSDTGSGLFNAPTGVAVARDNGVVYVTDQYNALIRTLTPGTPYTVATLAGEYQRQQDLDTSGLNPVGAFSYPYGIAVDTNNVYVSDNAASTVRQITRSGVVVSTIGGSDAQTGYTDSTDTLTLMRSPTGLAVDNSGNVFVCDTWNGTIRKLTLSSGHHVASTIVGGPELQGNFQGSLPGFLAMPIGIAVDATGSTIYVTVQDAVMKVTTP